MGSSACGEAPGMYLAITDVTVWRATYEGQDNTNSQGCRLLSLLACHTIFLFEYAIEIKSVGQE